MERQIPVNESAVIDRGDERSRSSQVCPDVFFKRAAIANVMFIGTPGSDDWVLIDAGVPGTAGIIERAAAELFGDDCPPSAIVLTHGHFDHIGAVETLLNRWNVPVYAHEAEVKYLNGVSSCMLPDPSVGGGLMAALSPLFPNDPIDISSHLRTLPADGSIPSLPEWKWIHTPGHTEGHVSLWRETDRTLIAGDAFITTRQESAYAVMVQKPELHGPPMYFTPDWISAEESVKRLAALEPERVVTGHGPALQGDEMRNSLHRLAKEFSAIAVPKNRN